MTTYNVSRDINYDIKINIDINNIYLHIGIININ